MSFRVRNTKNTFISVPSSQNTSSNTSSYWILDGSGNITNTNLTDDLSQGQVIIKTPLVKIGIDAGLTSQGKDSIAIGYQAGFNNQDVSSIAIGNQAGSNLQQFGAIAIGYQAGQDRQINSALAIGLQAGQVNQKNDAVAIGDQAGQNNQGTNCIGIGYRAGRDGQITNAIAIGVNAGQINQSSDSVSIGTGSGQNNQGTNCIAIGFQAGNSRQTTNSIAIGLQAAQFDQSNNSIAIGLQAARYSQQANAIAIGNLAASISQQANAIAIGFQAGQGTQGVNAIAIGNKAGQTQQFTNSIILNATGLALNTTVSGFFVKPIAIGGSLNGSLKYDTNSGAITYDAAKTFVIPHPINKEKYLVHGCLEGPEAGVYYRGKGEFQENEQIISIRLPNYISELARDFTVNITQLYNDNEEDDFYLLKVSDVVDNSFKVFKSSINKSYKNTKFNWIVFGKRLDIITEPNKNEVIVKGEGPYTYIN